MEVSVPAQKVIEIAPQSGTAFRVASGALLHIIDPLGEQVADLVTFAAGDPSEVLSNGRTFDYNETVRLTSGHRLYSNRSRVMLTIARDDVGVHDFLLTPCSRDTWRLCYNDGTDRRPGCFENMAAALRAYGIEPDAIPTSFNVFMNVHMSPDGTIAVLPPLSRPGSALVLRAEMDLTVALTACSAAKSNNGSCKPIRYAVEPPIPQ